MMWRLLCGSQLKLQMSGLGRQGSRGLGWPQCRHPKESEEQIPSCLSSLKLPGERGKGNLGGRVKMETSLRWMGWGWGWRGGEGVGHRGRAESWASSGKGGMDTPVHFRAVWHSGSGMTVSFTACVTGRGFQPFCLSFLTCKIWG